MVTASTGERTLLDDRTGKKRRIEELRRELKELEAVPRSDWHKAFEAFLNLRIAKYDGVRIDKEVEIGVNPPRADFIILQRWKGGF